MWGALVTKPHPADTSGVEGNVGRKISDLAAIVRTHERGLGIFAERCFRNRGLAVDREELRDVVSDAFLAAASRFHAQPDLHLRNPLAWFRKVLFFNVLRRTRELAGDLNGEDSIRELEGEDEVLEAVFGANPVPIEAEAAAAVREALAHLDHNEAKILEMTAEGFSSREIGMKLDLSDSNVRQIRSRAVAKLRRRLFRD